MRSFDLPLRRPQTLKPAAWLAAAGAGLLAACGGSDDEESFEVRTSEFTYASDGLLASSGSFGIVSADESASLGGGDLNGDLDTADRVPVALRFSDGQEFVIPAAAVEAEVLGDTVYLAVDETGNNQWNSNGLDELVLLRWRVESITLEFIAVLDPDSELVIADDRLFYAEGAVPGGLDETNVFWLPAGAGAMPTRVLAESGTSGSVELRLAGAEEGLVFTLLDEADNGDQNGDTDATDTDVLGLIEAGAIEPVFVPLGVAVDPVATGAVARAIDLGGNRFVAGFFVNESDQGDTNLNAGVPLPTLCVNGPDGDTLDSVLHFVEWELGGVAPTSNPPVNTGLAAAASAPRLLLTPETIGVLVDELGTGGGTGCDLNSDSDTGDVILRWVDVNDPGNPEATPGLFRAVSTLLPGGANGAKVVAERFLIATEQTFSVGGQGVTADYLFWVDPESDITFEAAFFDTGDSDESNELRVPIDWMSADSGFGRHPVGLLERGLADLTATQAEPGFNLNSGCNGSAKDDDLDDAIAAWVFYDSGANVMRLAGLGFAVDSENAGMVIENGVAYFRVDELADMTDYSGDNALDDLVLFRSPVSACAPTPMGVVGSQPGTPVIESDLAQGAVFLVDETDSGLDLNQDGLVNGFAARFFRFE